MGGGCSAVGCSFAASIWKTYLGYYTSADVGVSIQAYNSNLTAINQALTTTSSPSFTAVGATTFTGALTGTASGNMKPSGSWTDQHGVKYQSSDGTYVDSGVLITDNSTASHVLIKNGSGYVANATNLTDVVYMGAGANPQTQANATAGVACNWALGNTCEITLATSSSAMLVTFSNAVVGQVYRIAFIPGTTPTSYTPTYTGNTVHWIGGTPILLTGTAAHIDYATCYVRTGPIFDCGIGNNAY